MFHVEQILSNEIVDLLLKGELHPRGIAGRLDTNHMTVIRTLNRLADENVVDFRTVGKNKIYFLKRTLEGRNSVMMTEYYKLSKAVGHYPCKSERASAERISTLRPDPRSRRCV